MASNEKNVGANMIATAQVMLSCVFIVGYFTLIYQFMAGNVRVPSDFKEAFIALLGVLTAGVGTIMSFWFQRQRQSEPGQ